MSSSVERITRLANGLGVASLFAIMLLISADVFGRYFLNKPITGSFEITDMMMVLIVFLGIAYTGAKGEHVSLGDLILGRLPGRVMGFIGTVTNILSLGLMGMIVWQCAVQASRLQEQGTVSEVLEIPVYPFLWIAALGCALLCVVLLKDIRASLAQMLKRSSLQTSLCLALGVLLVLFLFAAPLWAREMGWKIAPSSTGFLLTVSLIVLLFVGMPVGFAMGAIGIMGMVYLLGPKSGITILRTTPYSTVASWTMTSIPLFVLMGELAYYAGLGQELFRTGYKWLSRMPGSLAMASVLACAGFAAVSGSGIATAATLGAVAIPEMKRYRYDAALATGAIAAGGSLGILIPPSIVLILYGILTEQSIGLLFAAGVFPGILEAVFYIITIYILCKKNIFQGPPGPKTPMKEKLLSLKGAWEVIFLFVLVMGGLYGGVFTPTEAAGVGAFLTLILGIARRRFTLRKITDSLLASGKITSMVFVILIGAMIFGYMLSVTRLPHDLASYAVALPVGRYTVLALILLVYLVFGCFISSLAMIVITIPIFFPVIDALHLNPIWFGILVVRMTELGTITPPYGIGVFVIKGIAKDVSTSTIYKGVLPFIIADMLHITLLICVPQISLLLPNLMQGHL
jgi:tripartite ATP-independent transporter DctM subunit